MDILSTWVWSDDFIHMLTAYAAGLQQQQQSLLTELYSKIVLAGVKSPMKIEQGEHTNYIETREGDIENEHTNFL